MAKSNTSSNNEDKAFYSVFERFEPSGQFKNKLGTCFQMKYNEQILWVTAESNFRGKQNSNKKFYVKRCIPSKRRGDIDLDVSQLYTNSSVGFLISNYKLDQQHSLDFGFYGEGPPEKACAYVFDGNKKLELKIVKRGHEYSLDLSASDKPSNDFEMRRAIGAPIIKKNGRGAPNQVVGILECRDDGTLYPVFFDENTFKKEAKEGIDDTQPIQEEQKTGTSSTTEAKEGIDDTQPMQEEQKTGTSSTTDKTVVVTTGANGPTQKPHRSSSGTDRVDSSKTGPREDYSWTDGCLLKDISPDIKVIIAVHISQQTLAAGWERIAYELNVDNITQKGIKSHSPQERGSTLLECLRASQPKLTLETFMKICAKLGRNDIVNDVEEELKKTKKSKPTSISC